MKELWHLLACPLCCEPLTAGPGTGARCAACHVTYPEKRSGQLDLRLRLPKRYALEIEVGGAPVNTDALRIGRMPANPHPDIDWSTVHVPRLLMLGNRLTPELLSYFPRGRAGGVMLDLGCGRGEFRQICAHTGMEYVGIDYQSDEATLLGDAHALPFRDESFDFVISFAVLEHLRSPLVAMREAVRVLKPGGLFIGSAAFLEPFHLDSYCHLSSLGIADLLTSAGFDVRMLNPNEHWTGLRAQAWMSLFPRAPMFFSNLVVLPVHLLHRLWWKLGHLVDGRNGTSEQARQLNNTGGFRFLCAKAPRPATRTRARAAESISNV